MINCILINSDAATLQILQGFLEEIPHFKLKGEFGDPAKALSSITPENADLIFLETKFSQTSGVDFYNSLSFKPEVIFIANDGKLALEAFEINAIDYLVKPVSFQKFLSSCNRAKTYIYSKKNKSKLSKDYFFINASHKLHKIFYGDILYLEGFKDYTKIHLKNSPTPLLVLYNLKYFETEFHENEFVRIHRSFIVPIRVLNTISRKSVTIGTKNIPVSDNYRDNLFSAINRLPNP